MNAERLHAIAIAIDKDLEETAATQDLRQIADALQNQVNEPQNASHQQTVSETLQRIGQSLQNAGSNRFSPAWQQNLQELGGQPFLGVPLLSTIREIFERNQITLSVALEEIRALQEKVEQFSDSIHGLVSFLGQLNIGAEVLDPGEIEIGVLVPREAVGNRLDFFAQELTTLNRTLSVFSELTTGTRPSFEIRSISSSDLTIFLAAVPAAAAAIAVAVERIVTTYKTILDIRAVRADAVSKGVPPRALRGMDTHANHLMETRVESIIRDFQEKYRANIDDRRRNEIETDLRGALNRIANRIDQGYSFDVRVEPTDEPSDVQETQEEIATILESSKGMQYLKLTGDPILRLAEPQDEEPIGPEDNPPNDAEDNRNV